MVWRAEKLPGMLETNTYYNSSGNPTWDSFFLVFTEGMNYEKPQYDPVFPGSLPLVNPETNQTIFKPKSREPIAYTNYDARPSIIGCVDDVYVCSSDIDGCVEGLNNHVDFASDRESEVLAQLNSNKATTGETTHFLLSLALLDIGVVSGMDTELFYVGSHPPNIVAPFLSYIPSTDSNLGFINIYRNLPQGHWKEIFRYVFKASLAQSQLYVLNIVRGGDFPAPLGTRNGGTPREIPQRFRGLCKMGKFHSVGWRNVSVWGLFGLLTFCAFVTLASVKTENDELWITIWARSLKRVLK